MGDWELWGALCSGVSQESMIRRIKELGLRKGYRMCKQVKGRGRGRGPERGGERVDEAPRGRQAVGEEVGVCVCVCVRERERESV